MSIPTTGEIKVSQMRTEMGVSGQLSLDAAGVAYEVSKADGLKFSEFRGKGLFTHTWGISTIEYYGERLTGFATSGFDFGGAAGSLSPASVGGVGIIYLGMNSRDNFYIETTASISDPEIHIETHDKQKFVFEKLSTSSKQYRLITGTANAWNAYCLNNQGKSVKIKMWTW